MMNSVGVSLFWIWPLLVIVGMALLGYTIARTWGGGGRTGDRDAARRILDERLARGEIDEQEYRHRRSVLDDQLR